MAPKLKYVIEYVADMDRAVKFYRDVVGLPVKFESPGWSEFTTGDTSLALHPASAKNPSGTYDLGFTVSDLQRFYEKMQTQGVKFTMPPTKQDFGENWRSSWIPKARTPAWARNRNPNYSTGAM
ncbi:MAG TPA: VOC family protein [Candidatus Acidoferrales bacterium]